MFRSALLRTSSESLTKTDSLRHNHIYVSRCPKKAAVPQKIRFSVFSFRQPAAEVINLEEMEREKSVTIDANLDLMDEMLEKAGGFFGTKKGMVDLGQFEECIASIRLNMPDEIKNAKKLVNDRKAIIDEANRNAEQIIIRAESRAKELTANHEITKAAQAKAAEIEKQALAQASAVKKATDDYILGMLAKAEETLNASLTAVKRTKATIKPAGGGKI